MFKPYFVSKLALDSCLRGQSDGLTWRPLLEISFSYRGYESRRVAALVDSGSEITLFQAALGETLGIPIKAGTLSRIHGFDGVNDSPAYFHEVQLHVAGTTVRILAGFSYSLDTPALLGRHGFFEHFRVAFDPVRMGLQVDRVPKD